MNVQDFLADINEYLPAVISVVFGIFSAFGSLVITYIKTRQKAIQAKVNKCIVSGEHNLDLSKYYVVFAGKKYYLDKIEIHVEGGNLDEKNESKKI